MNAKIKISVVIPLYNEEKNIYMLYERLISSLGKINADYEIVFINDGSMDSTLQIVKEISGKNDKVKYLSFSRNFGHQIALTAGLRHASGSIIVIMDGDLQDPPELISVMVEKWKQGFKVVYAKRTSRRGEGILKKITAKLFYRIVRKLSSIDIPLDTGDFRLIDRQVVDCLNAMPESNKFLRGQVAWVGFKQTFVEFEREKRKFGRSNYTLRKMIRFALDGITAFSDMPLKLATILGFIVSGFAFIVILYALYSMFVLHRVITGWTSLIISTMFIGGIQLLAIGIIGEYIGRIYNNVRKRPLYVVEESNV
ncbi:MAG TPA: glycosyltransferase family 2 protein [Chitinophagales bacterium]|nr:glycosyltransferase family 2 protein [Chitinophagales bacterium]